MVTTAALAARCPVLVAPAMNDAMLAHPATVANLASLRARGITVIDPGVGRLASRDEHGAGRLAEPADLLAAAEAALGTPAAPDGGRPSAVADGGRPPAAPDGGSPPAAGDGGSPPAAGGSALTGVRVLVTAGGTREPIDGVRYIGNRSSGRMGLALASAAADRGAEVTVVAANVALERDPRVRFLDVATAADLQAACEGAFPATDVLLMAAAVADFRPAAPVAGKVKKAGRTGMDLALEPTTDVLASLSAQRHPGQLLVGFAAEHGPGGLDHARGKLTAKGLDAVVHNDVSETGIGFDATDNEVTILTAEDERRVPRTTKARVAEAILDTVQALRAAHRIGVA
jgi:phosphopantothenoylcysteine decarboxylase / phosphopantothenate---cysteine ligase